MARETKIERDERPDRLGQRLSLLFDDGEGGPLAVSVRLCVRVVKDNIQQQRVRAVGLVK